MNLVFLGLIFVVFFGFFVMATLAGGSVIPSTTDESSSDIDSEDTDNDCFVQVGSDVDGQLRLDRFGTSVAISNDGNRMVVGAPYDYFYESGHVRVYQLQDSDWVQLGSDLQGDYYGDNFGYRVAISDDGNHIVVSAPRDDGTADASGQVRVFQYQDDTEDWVQLGSDLNGDAALDRFGSSVAISGDANIIVVGAPGGDNTGFSSGMARVYHYEDNDWVQLGDDFIGEGTHEELGYSVAISGDGTRIAVGGNTPGPAYARVFSYQDDGNNNWVQVGNDIEYDDDNDFTYSYVVVAVSRNGNRILLNAHGHVRVYHYSNDDWVPLGPTIFETTSFPYPSADISGDGNHVLVGEPVYHGNGCDSGRIRLYQYQDSGDWIQIGGDLYGEEAGDESGISVSVSGDGQRILVGAHYNDGNGEVGSGHARVFTLPDSTCNFSNVPLEGNNCDSNNADDDDADCFSSETTVNVVGKGRVKMANVKVGDQVLTSSKGKPAVIYSLDHRNPAKKTQFLQIYYSDEEGPLELTKRHMLFVEENPNPVPAHSVKAGDHVLTINGPKLVTKASTVARRGVFNPLTADGMIVVNGAMTSTYSALLSDNEWVEILGLKVITHQDLFTALLKPYSYYCSGRLSYESCQVNKNGRVPHVEFALKFYQQWKKQNTKYKVVVLSLVVIVAFLLKFAFSPYSVLAVIFAIAWKVTNKARQTKTMGRRGEVCNQKHL